MDLQQFVAATLSQIIQGVADAQKELKLYAEHVNPGLYSSYSVMHNQGKAVSGKGNVIHNVEFDVAVTVASSSTSSTGVTIGVVSTGTQEAASASTGHNRIKFSVPITLPKITGD